MLHTMASVNSVLTPDEIGINFWKVGTLAVGTENFSGAAQNFSGAA